jgi:Tol biopolymer transport system component
LTPSLRTLAFAVIVLSAGAAMGQSRTIHTDHYFITYATGTERTARRVAEVAEEIFPQLAAAFQFYDDFSPIHINVRDDSDYGNGSASDYTNEVNIWASNVDWEIRGEHDWIRNVLTHEIAHVITLDKARKKWPFRFALLQVSRSNSNPDISVDLPLYYMNTPKWWVEGIAQMGPYALGWDTWDSHRDMVLRMAVLEDDMHSYTEMGTLSNRTGGYYGEMVYNQGFGLLVYISDQFGRDKVNELQEHIGFFSFEVAIRQVLGLSAEQLYQDWVSYLDEQYSQQVAEIRSDGFHEGQNLGDAVNGGTLDYHPSWSPDGTKLAFISSEDRDYRIPHLVIHDFETGKNTSLEGSVDTRVSWSPDGGKVYFLRNKRRHNDLAVYDLDTEEEHLLSAGLRARDPQASPDGSQIVFSRLNDGNANLCIINVDGTGLKQLTNFEDGTQVYSPRWSPDGESLLFSIFRGKDRDIAMMRADSPPRPKDWGIRDRTLVADSLQVFPDSLAIPVADSSGFRLLLATEADERDPYWLPDGSGYLFSSDVTGVFNLYRHTFATDQVMQVTNVVGGAFTPAVAADGRVVYAGYHANNFDLFSVDAAGIERDVDWGENLDRDYHTKIKLPPLSEEYTITPAFGRRIYDFVPIVQMGPTFIGNQFGLNQVSGGGFLQATNILGRDQLTMQAMFGKNFRERTDLNTDFLLSYERSLYPVEGNNSRFNPSMFISVRRREVDYIISNTTPKSDTIAASTISVPTDSSSLLIPNAEMYRLEAKSREDRFKDIFKTFAVGLQLPMGRSQMFVQYLHRNYDEDWSLQHLRQQTQWFVVQDSVDISGSLPPALIKQDTTQISRRDALEFYQGLDFFDSDDLTVAWQYRKMKPTADFLINPTGRSFSIAYRYIKATVADSLAELTPVADGRPSNFFGRDPQPLTVNEYIASYNEHIGLPYNNRLSFRFLGAFKNLQLKDGFNPDGGFFEGRFYWPLRYYIGGHNLLSGYPYFTQSGSKLFYARTSYSFPVIRRVNMGFLNFTFAKLYAEVFAETGAVGNFDETNLDEFEPNDFLSDVGAELRLEMFTSYRIPLRAFFQVAHPLNRSRLQRDEAREAGVAPNDPDAPKKIDRLRFYFGLGFFPGDLLAGGRDISRPRVFE